jgi:hypothetical protein
MMTNNVPTPDDLPCDLLKFLAQNRGIDVAAAASLLGDFLLQYEPEVAAPTSFASRFAA